MRRNPGEATGGKRMPMAIEPALDERQLILQLKQGQLDAAGGLLDLHGESLMRYLHSILGSREAAEDAFQESWIKVMGKIDRFDDQMSFAPWLFRIARNVAYDALRRKRRWWPINTTRQTPKPNELDTEVADPTDFGHQVVARETIERLLKSLSPDFREVLFLRFFQDQSYEEIAEYCRLPLGTVKSRLKRGLDSLAKNLMKGDSHAQ